MEIKPYLLNYIKNINKGGTEPSNNNAEVVTQVPTTYYMGGGQIRIASIIIKKLPVLDCTGLTVLYNAFYESGNLEEAHLINTGSVTSIAQMFYGCTKLTNVSIDNTSNVTNCNNTFYQCNSLVTAPAMNTGKVTDFQSAFRYCSELVNVPQYDWSSVTKANYVFSNCPKLSDESINNIMAMCISATNYTQTKSFNYIAPGAGQRYKELSNYPAYVEAGWT